VRTSSSNEVRLRETVPAMKAIGNKLMVDTVNASRDDFVLGVDDLVKAESLYAGWLGRLLAPIDGLERYEEMLRALTEDTEDHITTTGAVT
jgi:hypothetical protein